MLSSLSRWIWSFRLRLGQAWRQWLRHERPSRLAVRWTLRDGLIVLLACLGVGLISAWPWLVQPSLRPGLPAPFEIRAPQDASVVDSEALAQRRSQLGPRIQVQITDQNATTKLERRLKRMLAELLNSRTAGEMRLTPIAITAEDEAFLLTQTPQQLQQWQLAVEQAQQRMLTQGVVSTLAEGQLERAAKLQLDRLAEPGRSLGAKLITRSLQGSTNLRTDNSLTQVLLNDLIQQNGVPKIEVKAGEVITVKGEVISQRAYDVLDAFGLISRRPATGLFLVRWIEASIAAGLMLLICRRWRTDLEIPQALLLLGTLAVVQGCKLWFGASVSALAVLVPPSLLLAEGLGAASGLAWLSLATFLWPIPLNSVGTARLLLAAAVAVVGVLLAGRQRSRAEMLQNAVLLTVAALLVEAALIQLMGGSVGGELLSEGILMGGLLLLALLISPTVERLFGMITRSRLLELCDLQRPLLRKLSSEAPGTFEHTLMICGLAEEGVRAIGGDVDLVRTGALYHDVGKLHAPQWFIENQQGDNPHDHLDDPWRSAEILQAHVDEGIKMARRYGLPQPVADFIPEHQGTLRMGYFWHRAREQNPNASDRPFRYRGPKPQSKESAVMMLADGCEAALRAMPPETDEAQACDGVRRIIHSRRHDGQLDDSGLGTGEIELVVRAFVKVWRRMRHRRIPYPIPARKAFSA
ncbi:MAG: HDIG domain-containing protein [Synechococcus sp. H1_metabat_bins_2.tsv.006]|nr:HDIG domain-containing protein [Synechococcus sp. H1_metabat_bins_2.tsv.006]